MDSNVLVFKQKKEAGSDASVNGDLGQLQLMVDLLVIVQKKAKRLHLGFSFYLIGMGITELTRIINSQEKSINR